jgi:hypothetical protein
LDVVIQPEVGTIHEMTGSINQRSKNDKPVLRAWLDNYAWLVLAEGKDNQA